MQSELLWSILSVGFWWNTVVETDLAVFDDQIWTTKLILIFLFPISSRLLLPLTSQQTAIRDATDTATATGTLVQCSRNKRDSIISFSVFTLAINGFPTNWPKPAKAYGISDVPKPYTLHIHVANTYDGVCVGIDNKCVGRYALWVYSIKVL